MPERALTLPNPVHSPAREHGDRPRAFVYVLALAAFAVGARRLILAARRRLAPWYAV